ncbi:MAG: hypothetical protein ABFQ95_08310 [Pseudomonadota bacterium]
MKSFEKIGNHLVPGEVYRRADLAQWSNAVDRHLEQLQGSGTLKKLSGGLYYCPKQTSFGKAPPSERAIVEAFLKDSRFLMFTPSAYNSLGVGTTQLYNETIVYNHKRHGLFQLGNKSYRFVRKHHFPEKLSVEFLLVDLVNNVTKLAEDTDRVLQLVAAKAKDMDHSALSNAVTEFGSVRARKFFARHLQIGSLHHGH